MATLSEHRRNDARNAQPSEVGERPGRGALAGRGRHLAIAAMAVAGALVVAACSSSGSSGGGSTASTGSPAASTSQAASAATTPASAATGSAVTIQTTTGALGTFLTDGTGRTLYMWVSDSPNKSNCSGQCATYWPPVTTTGTPVAGSGVTAAKLGVFARSDGSKQVSYNGWPLYYFAPDKQPGDTKGQGNNGFGALWWVLDASGTPITAAGASPSAPPSSAAGSSPAGSSSVAPPSSSSAAAPSPASSSVPAPPAASSSAPVPTVSSGGSNGYLGG